MKKLFFILLLLPMISIGQINLFNVDSTVVSPIMPIGIGTVGYDYDSIFLSADSSYVVVRHKPGELDTIYIFLDKYDTLRCMLLMCDTIKRETPSFMRGEFGMSAYVPSVFWKFGYVIVKNGWFTKQYLNERKKKFYKEVVVWDFRLLE